jgi:hypothetical protein
MKKPKSARYELMAMKTGDFMGKTEVLAEVSLDELKTIEQIAKALADDKSGVLLEAVKGRVGSWKIDVAVKATAQKSAEEIDAGVRAYERKHANLPWDLKLSLEREDGDLIVYGPVARFSKKSQFTSEMRRRIVIAVREITLSGAEQAERKPAKRGSK